MKLDLGCGDKRREGFIRVDRSQRVEPDMVLDLEQLPWPWPDGSVDEIIMEHVLEHLGQAPAVFFGIMQELYRVMKPGAWLHIAVPHPRSDNFMADPGHVRPILLTTMALFSRRKCLEAARTNILPCALEYGVDFEIETYSYVLMKSVQDALDDGRLSKEDVQEGISTRWNVVNEIKMTVRRV
jgi:ubiquinone/menaquinone biosynthesis C-methylase UbiE